MRAFLAALFLASLTACGCTDGALVPGDDDHEGYETCTMACLRRAEPSCRCSDRCPCWEKDGNGNRKHRTKEPTSPGSR